MLTTPWGDALDRTSVLPEHPRPHLQRERWMSLNGVWDFDVAPVSQAARPAFEREIVVPFSPEAPLSGVDHVLQPDEHGWYRRHFTLPKGFDAGRVLLHFGAVDQDCEVWIDGAPVGGHRGGMLPFTLDITDALHRDEHEIIVRVRDVTDTSYRARGKQSLEPNGIWYSPSSGIWQTVWLEAVPELHVTDIVTDFDLDREELTVTLEATGEGVASVLVRASGKDLARVEAVVGEPTRIHLPDARRWHPDDPFLHDLEFTLGDDSVSSYVGLRTVGTGVDASGHTHVTLNGEPIFLFGLLDQGYWPDGLLTPPSDEAMVYDITTAKQLGFNLLRKHCKLEPARWYFHCDRLGMLVWQDMVNGGEHVSRLVAQAPVIASGMQRDDTKHGPFGRKDEAGRQEFLAETEATIAELRHFPSIITWVPFNEGWGQFDSLAVTQRIKELDPTRLVDHASGWHDQGGGDFTSRHVYFKAYKPSDDELAGPRIAALTEYGGYSHRVPGHTWAAKEFGYRKYDNRGKFELAHHRLHRDEIEPAVERGLSVAILTQLTDVETETNGLITYDRKVVKLEVDRQVATARALHDAFGRRLGAEAKTVEVVEREITEPVSLILPDGTLNPAAVGWTRRPLINTDGIGGVRGAGRNKRWDYWAVTTPTHVVAMVISNVDYAAVLSLYTLVRETGEEIVTEATVPFGGSVELPGTLGDGRAHARTRNLLLRADEVPAGTRLRARGGRVAFDIVAHRPAGHEALGVVVPWNERTFQYTVKDLARPATGTIWIDDEPITVTKGQSFATLDHGRGRWPYDIDWNWGAGSGIVGGERLGIQVGGKWTDGSGSTENALFIDGRLHKISQELHWEYRSDDWMAPWRVTGRGIDLTFTPEHLRISKLDFKVLQNITHQAFGTWSGEVDVPDRTVRFDGLYGWAEDVHNRW